MAYYKIRRRKDVPWQAGDTGGIDFTVPDLLSITGLSGLFQVRDKTDHLLFEKTTTDGGITIVGQVVTVNVAHDDTSEQSGVYEYELELHSDDMVTVVTVGKGSFIISKEVARPQ